MVNSFFFFFKQKTAYEMRISDWSSDVCSSDLKTVPSVSVSYARNGNTNKANALGMRPMQERAYEKRGEQYLLIKSPPASGKSRALMFVALDKLANQGVRQAIIVRSEEHTSELQSLMRHSYDVLCLKKKKKQKNKIKKKT